MIKKSFVFMFLMLAATKLACASEPFSVLLAWQNDPATTMTITWVTEDHDESDLLFYRKEGTEIWERASGFHYPMPEKDPFWIHRMELTGLNPKSGYELKFGSYDQIYKFRTLSDDPKDEVRFVVGGDMYHDTIQVFSETNKQAAKQNPHFTLIGGDIAYAHGEKKSQTQTVHKKRWYSWMWVFSRDMVTDDGYLIPTLAAIGNHDVSGRYDQTPAQSPYYYSLFAMPGIPGYNVLDFGNKMSLFVLDSGHTNQIDGEQVKWLYREMEKRKDVPYKFAIYHVPAYPSVRKFKSKRNKMIRNTWVPIFEKFELTAAFENHEHAYKRTPPILQDKVDLNGVLYLGDGAWGPLQPRNPKNPENHWYLDKTASKRHFILVNIQDDRVGYKAVDAHGAVFDEVVQYAPIKYPVIEPVF